jgi:hypothetical protein
MEWLAFFQLEPWGSKFDDMRTASIKATLWNIHKDRKKHPTTLKTKQFLLMEQDGGGQNKQTWQEQKNVLKMIALAFAGRAQK